jgi:hypothetical protein
MDGILRDVYNSAIDNILDKAYEVGPTYQAEDVPYLQIKQLK